MPPHASLYWRFGTQMAIRQRDWVLVRPSLGVREYENIAVQALLFNLAKDIGQKKDLAAERPDLARALQEDWGRWNAKLPAPRWPATLKGMPFKMP